MTPENPAPLPRPETALGADDAEALADLFRRGTPDNTLRAQARDLAYIAAWKSVL